MYKRQGFGRLPVVSIFMLLIVFTCGLAACNPEAPTPPMSVNREQQTPQPTPTAALATNIPLDPTNTPPPDCLSAGGSLEAHAITSEYLQAEFHFQAYLPPCYLSDLQEGYPVVYLLHGLSYREDQWVRLGLVEQMDRLIAEGTITPFIVVLPQETGNQPPQNSSFPDMIVEELIPWIDSQYATKPERAFRGIGGLSRGAAWAVHIGFENPDLFSRIGAHSLPLFLTDNGKVNGWLTQEPLEDLPNVLIDIGRDDKEWQSAKNFADLLDQYHVPHEWYFYKDGHTETYWSEHLEQYLRWYAKNW